MADPFTVILLAFIAVGLLVGGGLVAYTWVLDWTLWDKVPGWVRGVIAAITVTLLLVTACHFAMVTHGPDHKPYQYQP